MMIIVAGASQLTLGSGFIPVVWCVSVRRRARVLWFALTGERKPALINQWKDFGLI